ncbi:unnamed protein product [Lota lota]
MSDSGGEEQQRSSRGAAEEQQQRSSRGAAEEQQRSSRGAAEEEQRRSSRGARLMPLIAAREATSSCGGPGRHSDPKDYTCTANGRL